MKPFLMPSPPLLVVLAGLACVFGAPACADQANPVLPPSGGHGGLIAGGGGTTGEIDALTPSDVADTAPTDTTTSGSDVLTTVCDLLKQNCQALGWDARYACYPVSGGGRCEAAGGTGAFGTCSLDTDCVGRLVCVPQSPGFAFGYCQPICDTMTDPTASACSSEYTCQPMPGFDKTTDVGRCTAL
jgi:hypothetical protein